ncbi:DUF3224 domain-containing protein [Intrasporangium sp. YIM S08009]|uniref:DUF3224 domain-containing protein n=1 Tax=Intrasporangium zincisolvens TaxID=3080018 RepID=UPI002B05BDF9|nr:DUF3224 domain-containing protein [Intrasporangium sp. YIM S08009]
MLSTSTFTTSDFDVTDFVPDITTALPTGHLRMRKTYSGDVAGRSVTQFTSAFDQGSGVGTYVAMESFEGAVGRRRGAFNFVHAASTSGSDRSHEYGLIVPGSGTGALVGIEGTVHLRIDEDGTHRMDFEHNLDVGARDTRA